LDAGPVKSSAQKGPLKWLINDFSYNFVFSKFLVRFLYIKT